MKWKLIIALAITIFLTVNIVLIFKGGGDISRINYITKWTSVQEQDLLETLPSAGVYIPKEEQHIYYDMNNGRFDGFLVEEGDAVEPGAELFEYSPADINATRATFEAEIDRLRKEITSIDQHISDMKSMQTGLSTIPSRTTRTAADNDDKDNEAAAAFNTNLYISQSIERDIKDKEWEKRKFENEIAKYEDLKQTSDANLMQLAVTSELSGTIQDIKHELTNPVITIISNEQLIEGNLTEDEVQQIIPGMKVFITYANSNTQINGTVDKVFTYPNEKPEVGKDSTYRFTVQLDDQLEQADIHGQHVDLKIVTNEVAQALTIPAKALKKKSDNYYSYIMGAGGLLERRKVEPGLKLKQTQEVVTGLQHGELVVMERPLFIKANQPYITRMAPSKNSKSSYQELTGEEIFKSIAKGFLAR
ncbi:efflux RND transporter periplasmic adaptor subunit [Cytobacillus purgationiresistens]|uniref:HlyD family secretion protein n=1 Tax=Cytobacillus purgationiresistens TaxID=863449 RepID=A0ABU0AD93_9BACI|nr:efflux RND transporter periplasmic adaptor subunit [Cytobacillus purgationiresistens]MDQ0269218.1 HlyD family secretion protein [Cytobacillus purgationiresistens]